MMQSADAGEGGDVVEAFPAKSSNHALAVGVLPRRPRRGQDLFDSHRTHATNEDRAIDRVSRSGIRYLGAVS